MLFLNPVLQSAFDFGEILPTEQANINALAKEISQKTETIIYLLDKHETVELVAKGNNGETIIIKDPSNLFHRTEAEIKQLLIRKTGEKSTIASYLNGWGVSEPETDSWDYPNYLKLLYFFYLARYIIFPDVNIFQLLSMSHLSTDISPVKNSTNGKYFSVILANLLQEDKDANVLYYEDYAISKLLSTIAKELSTFSNPIIAQSKFSEIEREMKGIVKTYCNKDNQVSSVVSQVIDYVYRYQNIAYAEEMIHTLKEEGIFLFDELELEANEDWKNEWVPLEDIKSFLKRLDVKRFYMQAHSHFPDRFDLFLQNIIDYDKELMEYYGQGEWLEESEEGSLRINGTKLATIAKTFLDLGTDKYAIYIRVNEKKRERYQSFRNSLTMKSPEDIAYRYFVIAYESELMNVIRGHGYYPTFYRPINIKRCLLQQEIMRCIFDITVVSERIRCLERICDMICKTIDNQS